MPRARRKASSPVATPQPESEPEVQEESEVQEERVEEDDVEEQGHGGAEGGGQPLQFNEPLSWKGAKNQIQGAELLRRLKALHEELAKTHQDDAHRESLVPVAQELAHHNLLLHKDRGTKAWVACCIVEVFRLLAPDAPYKGSQLKDIFTLIIDTIIPALGMPGDTYNEQHMKVLSSLNEFKSIILVADIPASDTVMMKLFLHCFDVLSGNSSADTEETLSKNVEYHMTGLLITLVDESDSLPTSVVDTVLAQFLRVDPSTFALQMKKTARADDRDGMILMNQLPPAYKMAKNVCNSCSEKMSRLISQYFSSVIVDASDSSTAATARKSTGKRRHTGGDDDEDETLGPEGLSEDDIKELKKAHRLLRELWRSAPLCIQSIVQQLDAELSAENVSLRVLATETVGDLISGIGAAGPPAVATLDPAAYPSQSLVPDSSRPSSYNFLTTPASPHSFSSVHPQAHQSFMNRRNDRSPQVRSTWAMCAGRILATSAGGVGLDNDEQEDILQYMADMLLDGDEKVRLAAVQAIARCNFDTIVGAIGDSGSVDKQGSVLSNLADRIKDRKHHVRSEAMRLLARLWGVAAGAISQGDQRIRELLGPIPTRIFEARFINDPEINSLIEDIMHDSLLPLNFPPLKSKQPTTNGNSQRVKDSQAVSQEVDTFDADAVRVERILTLLQDLQPKAKTVFFAYQKRQTVQAQYMEAFLKRCEEYNGGVNGKSGKDAKAMLDKLVDFFARQRPEPMTAADHLWKFVKKNEKRWYTLIRYAMSPDSGYKRVVNSIKELNKRVREAPGNLSSILATLSPILHSCSFLVYNRTHVPAILDISRTDAMGLGGVAHEVLKEISNNHPEVFRAHVKTMCETLVHDAPASGAISDVGTVETLKACAGFAQRFPSEIPQDRDFLQTLVTFAVHGSPPEAAKHAVTVITSLEDKKDKYIRDIVAKCLKEFKYGSGEFLSKLAALSQIELLAARDVEDEQDRFTEVALMEVLLTQKIEVSDNDPPWKEDIDDHCAAKIWALKILVNRLRGYASSMSSEEIVKIVPATATPVYKLLRTLVEEEGEIPKAGRTPAYHRSRLRLTAAVLLLRLSGTSKHFDQLLTHRDFNRLVTVAQDVLADVRSAFIEAVKKYLGQGRLPPRFYALVFLFAFEPKSSLKESTTTWIRARSAAFAKANDTTMELVFARFLSLLAHHPDFSQEVEPLKDFVEYIMFYLKTVASKTNLPLIYHIAQRVKSVQDGIDANISDNLYCLSDIAQAAIREFAEVQGWQLPAWSGAKINMPAGIFAALPGHSRAQEIADKQYAPEELVEGLEDMVKNSLKSKKRKAETSNNQAKKRNKPNEGRLVKSASTRKSNAPTRTPNKKRRERALSDAATPTSDLRRSTRASNAKSYAGMDDEDDDEEEVEEIEQEDAAEDVEMANANGDNDDKEGNKENRESVPPAPSEAEDEQEEIVVATKKPLKGAGKKVAKKTVRTKATAAKVMGNGKGGRVTRGSKKVDVMEISDGEPEDAEELSEGVEV